MAALVKEVKGEIEMEWEVPVHISRWNGRTMALG